MAGLGRRYGLRRDNFILDPTGEDSDFYARRTRVRIEDLVENLVIDLETGMAPKRLLFGPYGGGKTHTLHKTLRELGQLTPIHPVVVECPDMDRRSRFVELYKDGIMPAIGGKTVLELVEETVTPIPGRGSEILEKVTPEFRGDEDLAKAALRLRDPNFDPIDLWTWLSGVSVSATTLKNLSQRENLADATPARLAQLLVTLAALMKKHHSETMVLVLDEMERLQYVGEEGAVTFRTALTTLTDPNQRDLSVLFGASASALRGLPEAFGGEAAQTFVVDLLGQLRPPGDWEPCYPFTPESVEAAIADLRSVDAITPRRLLQCLGHILTTVLAERDISPSRPISPAETDTVISSPDYEAVRREPED